MAIKKRLMRGGASAVFSNFLILSTQRSGSTWLVDTLASHSQIKAYTELFLMNGDGCPDWSKYKDIVYWNTFRDSKKIQNKGASDISLLWEYLKLFYNRGEPNIGAYGFKLMYDQLKRYPAIVVYVIVNRVRIIHLYRENIVASVLSNVLRGARKKAHTTSNEELEQVYIPLDISSTKREIFWQCRKIELMKAVLRVLPVKVMSLSYESMVADPNCLRDVFIFLEVKNLDIKSDLKRVGRKSIKEEISNVDDLLEALGGTQFEPMLLRLY
jgi:LPS sulfotransferase NodH